jgi:hypothetical protein
MTNGVGSPREGPCSRPLPLVFAWEMHDMVANKTKPTSVSVAAFVNAITEPARRTDAKALMDLMKRATGEKAKMWGTAIIGFGTLHYRYESGREGDTVLVGFSPRKPATVLYGVTGSKSAGTLLAKLGKHTTGKGCLYIKKLTDVDQDVLEELIVRAVAEKRGRLGAQ